MGGAAHVIAEIADKERADLIVAGTRGHAPLSGLLLVLWRLVGAPVLPRLGNFLVSDFRATTFTGERNRKARHRGRAFLFPEEAVERVACDPAVAESLRVQKPDEKPCAGLMVGTNSTLATKVFRIGLRPLSTVAFSAFAGDAIDELFSDPVARDFVGTNAAKTQPGFGVGTALGNGGHSFNGTLALR